MTAQLAKTYAVTLALAILLSSPCAASPMRPITVEDCVSTRRVLDQEVQLSPDGSRVAYVVKAPNVFINTNNYQLYVRDVATAAVRRKGRLLLQADQISGVRWLSRTELIFRSEKKLKRTGALKSGVSTLNVDTGAIDQLSLLANVDQYSVSADGQTIVFSVMIQAAARLSPRVVKQREERGYPIAFGEGMSQSTTYLPDDEVFVAHRRAGSKLQVRRLQFSGTPTTRKRFALRDVLSLNLSPNGRYLLIKYNAESYPAGWANEALIKYINGFGTSSDTYVLELYDMRTGQSRLGFNYPGGLLHTSWSHDSLAYSVVGPAPLGTVDAKAEFESAVESGSILYHMNRFQNVFSVDVETGVVTKVLGREGGVPGNIKFMEDLPLSWDKERGPMLLRADDDSFVWLKMSDGEWRETQHFEVWNRQGLLSGLASNGRILVGVAQTLMIPPDLFAYDLLTKHAELLTDLNPEYRSILLGNVERIEWTNKYGSKCEGMMIKPVGFQSGKRYPMVFLSAPPSDVFMSDAPYTTAYAPQSLANAGFLVVISQYPCDDKIPKWQFPGDMRDAYNWMAMVESAVDFLAERGIVDKDNVGIAGFSRTSWLTDFTLTHSAQSFVAASSADSGIYTYGDYFMYNSSVLMRASETQVGGPPYGDSFRYWLEYAPPFNAERVSAAVLMEYIDTADYGLEFFTALSRLGKAVAFYRCPHGSHPLDTPFERVASLQRNLDWFRFWMQGYEGKEPEYDATQYIRWRGIRRRQEAKGN